ncbi:MAG: hypothetical protein HKN79_04945 [Flavobacteriales bacterium]|nr:hypothetical protein [Flavobacteriales bacterium]
MNPRPYHQADSRGLMGLLLLAMTSISLMPSASAQEGDIYPGYTVIHTDAGSMTMEIGPQTLHWNWTYPSNAILTHVDEQGGYQNHLELASSNTVTIISTTQDAEGVVYLCGIFKDTLFYTSHGEQLSIPAMNTANTYDSFIARTDGRGNWDWIQTLHSAYDIQASSAIVDTEGNLYVGGHFSEYVQFDPEGELEFAPWADLYIASYTPQGDFRWLYRTEIDHAFPTFSVHDLSWEKADRLTLRASHQEVDAHPMDVEMGRGETVIWNDRSAKKMELTVNAKGKFISARSEREPGRILGDLLRTEPSPSTFGHLSLESYPDGGELQSAPR